MPPVETDVATLSMTGFPDSRCRRSSKKADRPGWLILARGQRHVIHDDDARAVDAAIQVERCHEAAREESHSATSVSAIATCVASSTARVRGV